MDQAADHQYERMHRRLARRALFVCGASLLVALVVFATATPRSATTYRGAMASTSTLAFAASDGCTRADLARPHRLDMPIPEAVAKTLLVRPAPDVEQLSPPQNDPQVSAAEAWSAALRDGFGDPSSSGSAQILLGQLYAATPAIVQPDHTSRPVYTHTLVWAVFSSHQPEPVARGSSPSVGGPPCYFESTMLYIDAATGHALVGEVFPPGAGSIASA
jgi:hypothetical protein